MKLEELLKETDALTFVNSLKVTLTEIKDEVSSIEEMQGYINHSVERIRKLMRKVDNQYRLVAKLVQKEGPFATDLEVKTEIETVEELKELMEGNE